MLNDEFVAKIAEEVTQGHDSKMEKMQAASDEYMVFAEEIQDACNPVAVLVHWAEHARDMMAAGFDHPAFEKHPATYAVIGKMMSLCQVRGIIDMKVLQAYDDVSKRVSELKAKELLSGQELGKTV